MLGFRLMETCYEHRQFSSVPAGARNNRDGADKQYKPRNLGPGRESHAAPGFPYARNEHSPPRTVFFEDEMDARWFWEVGYKERLFKGVVMA